MKIKPIQVKGNGTSLWGKSDEVYTVDKIILNYNNQNNEHCAEDFGKSFWGEIQMFGPNTKFKISWSEQGMQPEKGWSFDVSAKII
jgi:hypothetical protein